MTAEATTAETTTAETTADEFWMRAAIEEGLKGKGWCSPRPSVGCVLVRDNRIIGRGFTQPGDGAPHAEIMAIRAAWRDDKIQGARGAAAYTTLEPCAHWGTTPPCCDALVRENVARVVIGVVDPDPRVAGRGIERMGRAGIELEIGVLADACFASLDEFLFAVVEKRPFVTLKAALSLDGNLALDNGESKWITGPLAREKAHQLRHRHDAVLVGIGTVMADDPQLSVRLEGTWKQPKRIVLDGAARLPLHAKIWDGAPELPELIVVCRPDAPAANVEGLRARGAQVWMFDAPTLWPELMKELWRNGIYSVLIEGGARVASSAWQAGAVAKVALFVAPILIGDGQRLLPGLKLNSMDEATRLRRASVSQFGADILVEGYGREPGEK